MVSVKLLRFGILSELIEEEMTEIEFEQDLSVEQFKQALIDILPQLRPYSNFTIAINEVYASRDQMIQDGDVLALIPPVAGG